MTNEKMKALWIVLISLLFVGCSSPNVVSENKSDNTAESQESGSINPEIEAVEDEIIGTVTIRSIGDILTHNNVYEDAYTDEGYNFDHMFELIKPYLENADITTANLETIAAGSVFGPSTYPYFNAPEEIIDALLNAGVDIVNNGTNHTLDFGAEGAYASISSLQERDMIYVGSYQSWEDYNTPRIIEVDGIQVGFLSYAYDANGHFAPEGEEHLLSLIDLALMPLEIEELNEQVDVSVVMFHNGNEYDYLPNENQLYTMQIARDAGANFILGGHPHVLQPFIYYNESQGGHFSHGNFLSGQYELDTKIGGISEYTFNKLANGGVELASMRFMPTYNYGMPETTTNLVVPLAEASDYGVYQSEDIFNELTERMRYYTNEVEVVEYLD